MRLFTLCRDRGNPRRLCRGIDCRCQAQFVFVREEHWRPPSRSEDMYYCHGCGRMNVVTPGQVDYWTACINCRREFRVTGTSRLRTWLWHLFGRHEGYNDWDMWRTWL